VVKFSGRWATGKVPVCWLSAAYSSRTAGDRGTAENVATGSERESYGSTWMKSRVKHRI